MPNKKGRVPYTTLLRQLKNSQSLANEQAALLSALRTDNNLLLTQCRELTQKVKDLTADSTRDADRIVELESKIDSSCYQSERNLVVVDMTIGGARVTGSVQNLTINA